MNMPPEYHGPHAKRWTDPDTGTTYSLKPSDYVAVAGQYQLQQEHRRQNDVRTLLDQAQKAGEQAARRKHPDSAEPTVIHQWGTEAEYLGNFRGPQPIAAYIDEHTIDINIEDTSEEASVTALQAIDRELIRRGWKNSPEADASVEESSASRGVGAWLEPVSARAAAAEREVAEKSAVWWRNRRRWVPKFLAGIGLVYIIVIIGVTLVSMGGQ